MNATVAGNGIKFLYPTSRQFPFDEVCEQIVRELELRGWNVPGIDVEFYDYGSGEERFRRVGEIRRSDFRLCFGRPQGRISSDWSDTAAIDRLFIPKRELHVNDDESGPTMYVYAGKNWERDRERFMFHSKINSKLNREGRWYLKYKGACNCGNTAGAGFDAVNFLLGRMSKVERLSVGPTHTHRGRREPLLVHDSDLDLEYDPKPGMKWFYRTAAVFDEFTHWLTTQVLWPLQQLPVTGVVEDYFEQISTPFPKGLSPIFTFGDYDDAERINAGREDATQLNPSKRYGLQPDGYRLVPLMGVGNDGTFPEKAYDGFRWCAFGEVTAEMPLKSLEIPDHWRSNDRFVLRITPRSAEDIYVADNAPYVQLRREQYEANPTIPQFTDAEIADQVRARARTLIPITEYDGSFGQPIVLVARELGLDEVEVVSGPWDKRR